MLLRHHGASTLRRTQTQLRVKMSAMTSFSGTPSLALDAMKPTVAAFVQGLQYVWGAFREECVADNVTDHDHSIEQPPDRTHYGIQSMALFLVVLGPQRLRLLEGSTPRSTLSPRMIWRCTPMQRTTMSCHLRPHQVRRLQIS